ncbi:MAG: hypothetical protein H6656_10695 [Ardenticatenaceae bacterium]|nr:hypothetical protein [Ardenticatenaceae bacterium]
MPPGCLAHRARPTNTVAPCLGWIGWGFFGVWGTAWVVARHHFGRGDARHRGTLAQGLIAPPRPYRFVDFGDRLGWFGRGILACGVWPGLWRGIILGEAVREIVARWPRV